MENSGAAPQRLLRQCRSKIKPMPTEDVDVAGQFLAALSLAAECGDREAVYPLLAADIEWVTPKRTLRGIEEIREELTWGSPPEKLALELRQATGSISVIAASPVTSIRSTG